PPDVAQAGHPRRLRPAPRRQTTTSDRSGAARRGLPARRGRDRLRPLCLRAGDASAAARLDGPEQGLTSRRTGRNGAISRPRRAFAVVRTPFIAYSGVCRESRRRPASAGTLPPQRVCLMAAEKERKLLDVPALQEILQTVDSAVVLVSSRILERVIR